MDKSRFKDVGSLLSAFFDEEKLRRGGRYAQFFESWRAIVGERLASHSRVVDLDKGILIVEAEHPGWIQLLQVRQTQTLDALARRFPDLVLRGIAFRLTGDDFRLSKPPSSQEAPDDTSSEAMPTEGSPEQEPTAPAAAGLSSDCSKDPEFLDALSSLKKAIQAGKKK